MGMGVSSYWHWILLLIVVILVFGTAKLKNIGKDLGGAIKGFKEGMKEAAEEEAEKPSLKAEQTKKTVDTTPEDIIDTTIKKD